MVRHQTFQEQVYEITKQIPKGYVMTYGQIAALLGNPHASRAVGMCLSRNNDPKTIPCHRVVSSSGRLTGYAFGGVSHKKVMLEKEGVTFTGECVNLHRSQWKRALDNNLSHSVE